MAVGPEINAKPALDPGHLIGAGRGGAAVASAGCAIGHVAQRRQSVSHVLRLDRARLLQLIATARSLARAVSPLRGRRTGHRIPRAPLPTSGMASTQSVSYLLATLAEVVVPGPDVCPI